MHALRSRLAIGVMTGTENVTRSLGLSVFKRVWIARYLSNFIYLSVDITQFPFFLANEKVTLLGGEVTTFPLLV
jgi:hypothetical protein